MEVSDEFENFSKKKFETILKKLFLKKFFGLPNMPFFEKSFNFKAMWVGTYSAYYSNPIYQKNWLDPICSTHFELEAYDKYQRIYF